MRSSWKATHQITPAARAACRVERQTRDRSFLAAPVSLLAASMLAAAIACWPMCGARAAAPEGQLTWGLHFSLAPTWFDPAETPALITPFKVMYALHDAVIKPMPGNAATPSLAESWTVSPDKRIYEFKLRPGIKFHNGEPVTPDDVKFSFERYRGASNKLLKDRTAAVEIPDAQTVRFVLKDPWPDFITFYASATGAGWVVPRKYVEQVGEDGYKKAPIGAGPYKFVSFVPGLELTVEANEHYWRKVPRVKRLVFRSVPDETTRLAALKRGEIDIAYAINGELARDVQRTKGLRLDAAVVQATFYLYFPDQWNDKSPWSDVRVRQAAYRAIDHSGINQALLLGHARNTGNAIVPDIYDYYWAPPAPKFDRAEARRLLAEAGHPNGFDAGDYWCDSSWSNVAEAVVNDLQAVGIRVRLRPVERVAFAKAYAEKSLKHVVQAGTAAFGNAATRLEALAVTGGAFSYGGYPDIDALFKQQAVELDDEKRKALLHRMQQLLHEKMQFAHIWQLAFLIGVGPRVDNPGLGFIPGYGYSAPYEDITLAGK